MLPAILRHGAIALFVAAGAFAFIGQFTDLDLILADLFFDPARHVFPYNKSWFARDFMHGHVKNVIVWSGFILFAVTLFDFIYPLHQINALKRAQLRVLALAAFLEPILIRTLKESSALHCPWGVDRYDGSAPFLRLFDSIPAGWSDGHCFPAGHASVGMWLSALAVFWLPQAPRRALAAFAGGLGIGLALGWVQQMRGQHFLTHTLWTAWLSSALLLVLLALFARPLEQAAHQSAPEKTSGIGPSNRVLNIHLV